MRRSRSAGRSALVACALVLGPVSSWAQDRPAAATMSCESARGLVAGQGAVVIATGPNGYDRFVRDSGFCGIEETTSPGYVRTTDSPSCFIGYYCRNFERGEGRSE